MRRRLKNAILLLLSALAALFVFVGCELGMTKEEALDKYDLTASVTYYANGGEFSSGAKQQEIWYKKDSFPINLTGDSHKSGTTLKLTRKNYKFLNWYHIVQNGVDENGMPILDSTYDEETKQTYYTPDKNRPVDFSKKLQENDHWYICADWEAKLMIEIYLVSDSSITDNTGKVYNPTEQIRMYSFRSNGAPDLGLGGVGATLQEPIKQSRNGKTHTFIGYYFDAECTQLATNVVMEDKNTKLYAKYLEGVHTFVGYYFDEEFTQLATSITEETEDMPLYVKYIEGEWTIVRTAEDVKDMLMSTKTTDKFYFIYDIDMAGKAYNVSYPTKATIKGNGFALKNLKVEKTTTQQNLSLFGKIGKDAVIENLTFENLTCNWTVKEPYEENVYQMKIFMVCESIEEGATIENVTFKGNLSMVINNASHPGVDVENYNGNDGYKYTNCLFGGDSDAAYTEANPNGFKVEGNPAEFITLK
ncbi:MAG: hypothetical protein IJV83_05100 [Clostridia bacterium]|nr:hypothetical protein [Clostridia bacterium]